ncbi:MAG: GntR family transcriptional regulator [Alphaproteobacteria bacterium]|nr:GntR family transcriptional regulator [Alphaproteobacteria bacterium]
MRVLRLGVPLYLQIFEMLLGQIRSGAFPLGAQLPTEEELQAQFGVSRNTVRGALDKLVQAGLISRQSGKGTFVTRSDPRVTEWSISSVEDLIDLSFAESYDVLGAGPVPASRHPAPEIFGAGPDGTLFLVRRVRSNAAGPYSYSETWFPEDIGGRLPVAEMTSQPLLQLVERTLGVRIVKAEQVASAEAAPAATASLLDMEPGAPLLVLVRTYYDATDRVLEQARVSYRANSYTQSVTFRRDQGAALAGAVGA